MATFINMYAKIVFFKKTSLKSDEKKKYSCGSTSPVKAVVRYLAGGPCGKPKASAQRKDGAGE